MMKITAPNIVLENSCKAVCSVSLRFGFTSRLATVSTHIFVICHFQVLLVDKSMQIILELYKIIEKRTK